MNFLFLLTTATSVSLDSFFAGFSLSSKINKKLIVLLGLTSVVFLLCLITNTIGIYLQNNISEKSANVGGIILVAIGLYNIFSKQDISSSKNAFKLSLILGFGVGLDGAFANLSLSIMGYNSFYVPIIIAIMHLVFIGLGILLSSSKIMHKLNKIKIFAPLILISLGLYKIACFFI